MSIIKSNVWQSENEWRLMWRNDEIEGTVYKCPIGKNTITNIFLGLQLASEKIEEIISAAKLNFPEASILRAHKRLGDLALEFHLL